jgi:hypothetical protein
MNFPSIEIQGSIISADLFGKIRSEQASFQQGKDFNKDFTNARLKDEISAAWQDAKGQWAIFRNKLSRVKEGETGTTETRNFWIVPLLTNLGYNLNYNRQAEEINGKTFPIPYRDGLLDGFPVYIGGYYESPDKRPENKLLRVSPHAMVQEYLNYSEHLYGLVTNGRQIRLLRDASRITRLSYVEFNLQKMMEEDLYSDFVLLFRLLHASRMPQKMDGGAESIIEKYHHEGLEAGSTIRSKLGIAVKESIRALANGFINHPDNEKLRLVLQEGNLDASEYYRQQLRIIYRLLFLFVIEERNLVYADSKTPETKRFAQIYYNYYSLLRLRKLARKLPPPDAERHYDLWQSLLSTFALFEKKTLGEKLGIMSLQGDLFGPGSINSLHYDLHECRLSNALVLQIIKALGYFENQNNVQIAVNYGGLDVEEFGSVYEGLLELQLKIEPVAGSSRFSCTYAGSEERSKSGSHYTPDELVQPLIKHSLDYLLDDRRKIITDTIARQRLVGATYRQRREELVKQHIYTLKVCDVACGSGHLLISGARRIAEVAAAIIEEEEQPNPKAFQHAKRNAILNCIYGVDKNPLAVELCKVALWLEAYLPGQPLNFLDHHIKCGDAIVGLAHRDELENGIATEAFKTLPGDDKDIAKAFRDQNSRQRNERVAIGTQLQAKYDETTENSVQEALVEYKTFSRLPETSPDEIDHKAKAYKNFVAGKGFTFLKAMADTQVAQFFIAKTTANKDALMTDADFRQILIGYKGWQDRKTAKATAVALEQRIFHWFLEFPEVFNEGGFDCILGNPPYLGGSKISGSFGKSFLEYLHSYYSPTGGQADLIAYFLRRIYSAIKPSGFFSLVTTNTVAQSETREGGLEIILNEGGHLIFALPSIKWPGVANLFISEFSIFKGQWKKQIMLDKKPAIKLNSDLTDLDVIGYPFSLYQNQDIVFKGTDFGGDGFIIDQNTKQLFIKDSEKNVEIIFPLINGLDINDEPNQKATRFIINFFDWSEEAATKFNLPYEHIKKRVYPTRLKNNRDIYRIKWWVFCERRVSLYQRLKSINHCFASSTVTKFLNLSLLESNQVFSNAVFVFGFEEFWKFSLLQSNLHNDWTRKYSSTLETRLRYAPTDCFETFPFPQDLSPQQEQKLEQIGEQYHEYRRQLMLAMQLGLTKTYNAFHAREINAENLVGLDKKTIEKQYGKEVWNLWNHLNKAPGTCNLQEAIAGIIKLRQLHVEMDNAVLEAYGWAPPSPAGEGPGVRLRHDFYEVDYLPENDRIRYTIHPEARKEILKRLLELNHKIHEEEVKAGLWDKKKTPSKKVLKNYEVNEPEVGYGDLFGRKEDA